MSKIAELQSVRHLVGDHEFDSLLRKAESTGLDRYSALGFRDSQQVTFSDSNNGSYNGSIVRFDTVSSQSQYVNWSTAKVMIPLTLVSSCPSTVTESMPAGIYAQDYSVNTPICFKPQGALSLITGIKVSLASGAVLLNEQGSNWYHSALRTVMAHDSTWWEGEGAEVLAALPSGSSSTTTSVPQIFYGGSSHADADTGTSSKSRFPLMRKDILSRRSITSITRAVSGLLCTTICPTSVPTWLTRINRSPSSGRPVAQVQT